MLIYVQVNFPSSFLKESQLPYLGDTFIPSSLELFYLLDCRSVRRTCLIDCNIDQ